MKNQINSSRSRLETLNWKHGNHSRSQAEAVYAELGIEINIQNALIVA